MVQKEVAAAKSFSLTFSLAWIVLLVVYVATTFALWRICQVASMQYFVPLFVVVLGIAVLATCIYMLINVGNPAPIIIHGVALFLLGSWLCVALGFEIFWIVKANSAPLDGGFRENPANDPRWHCLNGADPTCPAPTNLPQLCLVAVTYDQMRLSGAIIWQLVMTIVCLVVVALDAIFTGYLWRRADDLRRLMGAPKGETFNADSNILATLLPIIKDD